jgi:hypothetical protein
MTTPFRVLDIDLDAFVDPIAYWPRGGRLDNDFYSSWSEVRLRQFLERQCGLSTKDLLPGVFVEQHDSAYDELANIYERHGPIDLTHVDGHADLGMGDPSWVYMHKVLLQLPMAQRGSPLRGNDGMNLGSWLVYVAAAGWLKQVTFVHPHEGANDLPPLYFRNADPSTRILELKRYDQADLGSSTPDYEKLSKVAPAQTDPEIPFKTVTLDAFMAPATFNFCLLCQSPSYTPTSADALIPIIREYVQF